MDALATPAKAIDIPRTISFHSKSLLAMYPSSALRILGLIGEAEVSSITRN
jgi:hypothetical protein